MKIKALLLLVLCMILTSFSVCAINFDAEKIYNSVVIVYTNEGVGSGFAAMENLIITNAHVVGNKKEVQIKTYDNSQLMGKVVKYDPDIDLALISVNNSGLAPLTINAEAVKAGQEIYAIGAPENIPYTMTKGIISNTSRKIGTYTYIQIDASINSGNSGGPLIDDNGEVLGINTMKIADAEGIGFAIGASYITDFLSGTEITGDVREENNLENNAGSNADDYKRAIAKNENLIIILSVIVISEFIIILLLVKKKKKTYLDNRDEYDFEIDIEE